MIRVIAADDHLLFLEGIKSLFSTSSSVKIVDVCSDGESLMSLVSTYNPDIALVDISMPGPGIECIVERLEALQIKVKIIVLTMHLEPNRARKLFKLGLNGYVLKEDAFEQLELAILAVAEGDEYISPTMLTAMRSLNNTLANGMPTLSARELEVAQCLSEGLTNKMIARELAISERTVRFHISNCCLKLDANRRSNVVTKALQLNLIN